MSKIRLRQVLVVEGKYDATALAGVVDGLILTTKGFSIFSDEETRALLQRLGRSRGIVVLTDSDAAGFRIRQYIEKVAAGCQVIHAYIPAVPGKEGRKSAPSKEGTLGVEGMPPQVLRKALLDAGVMGGKPRQGRDITYTDLYEWGLSGGPDSAKRRRDVLARLGLPQRLSKKALCEVLSSLYTHEEFEQAMQPKPVLFWDFHGTLSLPDVVWFDAAMEAAAELVPEKTLNRETLERYFSRTCLPWYSIPSRDTRRATGENWWKYSEAEFEKMFVQCGFDEGQAKSLAPALRGRVLQPARYGLYPDAISTLQELQKRGYESYILSNNYPELDTIVQALGLLPYVRGVLVSGQIGYDKPRPEIFEAARKAAARPEDVWMIGDSPSDDIEGGKAAGFTTVAVHGVAAPADHSIDMLGDILELLP